MSQMAETYFYWWNGWYSTVYIYTPHSLYSFFDELKLTPHLGCCEHCCRKQGVDASLALWLYFLWLVWKVAFPFLEDPMYSLTTVLALCVCPPSLFRPPFFSRPPYDCWSFVFFIKSFQQNSDLAVVFKNWWLCVRMCVHGGQRTTLWHWSS